MNILMDTHIVIWALTNDRRLSGKARDLILDPGNNLYYSAASVFESPNQATDGIFRSKPPSTGASAPQSRKNSAKTEAERLAASDSR